MVYVPFTTYSERSTIDEHMTVTMEKVERARRMLRNVWEDYFARLDIHTLNVHQHETVGDMLYVIEEILWDVGLGYALTVGDCVAAGYPGVEPFMDMAKQIEQSEQVNEYVHQHLKRHGHGVATEEDMEKGTQLYELSDNEALPQWEALLAGTTAVNAALADADRAPHDREEDQNSS